MYIFKTPAVFLKLGKKQNEEEEGGKYQVKLNNGEARAGSAAKKIRDYEANVEEMTTANGFLK